MAKTEKTEPPRIFISHAWEDKALVRRLESQLKAADAEVWVDHVGIRGGDNLPERISEALDWCNTLLLVWSKAAASSRWVKLEWTNAISLDRLIVPCSSDKTPLPSILAHKAYIDFSDTDRGLHELLRALQLAPPNRETRNPVVMPASVPHSPVMQASPSVAKPLPKKPVLIQLRHTPVNPLSYEAMKQMLRDRGFFDRYDNKLGKGIQHHYEGVERQIAKLVIDHATGLTWQQGGSEKYFSLKDAEAYIGELNVKNYGSYSDWRLPTLEEAMSLMECEKKNGDLYIDPVFDKRQWWIWTADRESAGQAWCVTFASGNCFHDRIDSPSTSALCVRDNHGLFEPLSHLVIL